MRTEQVALANKPAIRHAKKVRFCPIPTGVETKRPPKRPGVPKAEAEEQAEPAAPKSLTGVSPGFVPWENPNSPDSSSAPHQNPIPRVRVNCR